MIIFRASLSQQKKEFWELGIPFLKKYQMVFNSDTKKIGYYTSINLNDNKNLKRNKIKRSSSFYISFRTLAEIIFGIIFILILLYLIKKIYTNKIRQKRPFELQDEDYDYFIKNKDIKNNNNDVNNSDENKLMNGKIIEMQKH